MQKTIFLALLSIFFLSGCVQNVKSWEKETLSKQMMQESGGNTLLKSTQEHVHFSKEASKGGSGVSGGGCGCK